VIVLKSIQAMRVMEKNVCVEHKILNHSDFIRAVFFSEFREEVALLLGIFDSGGTLHGVLV
jgi:hypothetical protein